MSAGGCTIGAFVNGIENIPAFEKTIGRKLGVVLFFTHWQNPFPLKEVKAIIENGSVPLLTWEPWITDENGALNSIISGKHDEYMLKFLKAAKEIGQPIFLRFAHEMNGDWYPWSGTKNNCEASGPELYSKAWKHLHTLIYNNVNAKNIKLVWCVNHDNLPLEKWNDFGAYYPGDEFVDWIALDGYNWGYEKWQSFDEVFSGAYKKVLSISGKPLMIAEFASAESGRSSLENKNIWIKDAFEKIISNYDKVKIFCWFNINKERDWRVDSSAGSEAALRSALQNVRFLDKIQNYE